MLELLLADGADIDNMTPGSDVIPLMLTQTLHGRVFAGARS